MASYSIAPYYIILISLPQKNKTMFRLPAITALFSSLFFCAAHCAIAQQPTAPVESAARALIEEKTRSLSGEIIFEISPLDAGNHLPPCSSLTAFLPASSRAWGTFSVGVRCTAPVDWTIYLQAKVSVIDDYLVIAHPLRAGQIIGSADIAHKRGNIAALPDNVLTDASQAIGRPTRYALAQGLPLQARMLRIPEAVKRGSEVTVFSHGASFAVSNTGRALNSAAPGEAVKVRFPNNRVVTGTAQPDGTVKMP